MSSQSVRGVHLSHSSRLTSVLRRLLAAAGVAAYVVVCLVLFLASAYLSFNLFVRKGVTSVPELAGMAEDEAAALLGEQGLKLRRSDTGLYDDAVAEGRILDQRPRPGGLVKRGSAVEIVLSQGPRLIRVPELLGQALPAAQLTASAEGIGLHLTANVFSDAGAPGTVIAQDPPAGALVDRAASVDVLVALASAGDAFLMPDLVYRHYEPVRRLFERRGFRLGNVKFEPYEGIAPGVVLRQFPLPGHPVRRRDAISLVVAGVGP